MAVALLKSLTSFISSNVDSLRYSFTLKRLLVSTPIAIVGVYGYKKLKEWWRLPPGPLGLPFIGVLPFVDVNNLAEYFKYQCNKHNGIFSVYIGTQLFVVINDFEMIKEMLPQLNFAGRLKNPLMSLVTQDCGIIFAEGESWSRQRRLTFSILRDMGFAKTASEDKVISEALRLRIRLEEASRNKEAISMGRMLMDATNTVIASLTFAERPADDDKAFKTLAGTMERINSQGFFSPAILFPFLGNFIWLLSKTRFGKVVFKAAKAQNQYIEEQIAKRKEVLTDDMEPECLCDGYIQQQRKSEKEGDAESYKDMQIMRVCLELFFAGTDTTSRSLEWMLIYMSVYPDVQENVFKEISSVLGTSKHVEMSDRGKLPYCNAVIEESMRYCTTVIYGIYHRSIAPTYFHNYLIPSDALILPFIYGVHFNEEYFQDARKFDPTRFLDETGQFNPNPHMIAFLLGRRSCLGESLARMEMFLFFVSIMQRFSVHLAHEYINKTENIIGQGVRNGMHFPGDYKLVFEAR